MNDMTMMMNEYNVICINQCLCLPKAELNTKNTTKRPREGVVWLSGPVRGRLVEFLVFNSIH